MVLIKDLYMDCPVGTVKTYLNKALGKLRITIGKEII
jgi:DNA-directed RNA polymerase specialized sigma24 family protein